MRHLLLLLVLIFLSSKSFSIETKIKGFIALDILKAYKKESSDPTFQTGIGTIDLKFYAYHDNMSFKLKLDLDDSDLDEANNLFEEASATYRITKSFKITAGKGVVPFHQKRYGVLESAYVDGGSALGGSNSWRDQDNKLLLIFTFGGHKKGFMNHFTIYGDSKQIETNSDGTPKMDGDKLVYQNSKTFQTDKQRGLANKIEFFIDDFKVYTSGIYYHNDHYPMDSWAVDTGARYKTKELEIWFETMYGFYSTHSGAKYAAYKQWEKTIQLGGEIYLSKLFNFSANMEAMDVKKATWSSAEYHDKHFKIDLGPKYKIRKNAFITYGAIWERKKSTRNSVYTGTQNVFGTALKLSFWY